MAAATNTAERGDASNCLSVEGKVIDKEPGSILERGSELGLALLRISEEQSCEEDDDPFWDEKTLNLLGRQAKKRRIYGGTGKVVLLLTGKDKPSMGRVVEIMKAADEAARQQFHEICLVHLQELFSCKDTTTQAVFVDGHSSKISKTLSDRTERIMCRIDTRTESDGTQVSNKLLEKRIKSIEYVFQPGPDEDEAFRFVVEMQ